MASNYNEDYLNGLIAKAKKSWEGVDVESFMSDLRDDSFDKEVAEELSKEVTSHIIEQIKSNMNTITVKCRDLMVGDWCCDKHGLFPMQIIGVGDDYAYATLEGHEGDPWEFDDKEDSPQPIEITEELLKANGWEVHIHEMGVGTSTTLCYKKEAGNYLEWKRGTLSAWIDYEESDYEESNILVPCKYVHQLQRALRIAGLTDMANNFKV